jgi:phage gp45-like
MSTQTVLRIIDDSKGYPVAQVEHNGKATNTLLATSYGLCTKAPGGELCITLKANGNADSAYSFPLNTINRLKDLEEGEVVLFNSKTGAYIKLKEDGSIEAVTGDSQFNLNPNGSAELTAPLGLTIAGDVTVTGTITGTVDVLAGPLSVSGATHVHGGVTPGGGFTAPPT